MEVSMGFMDWLTGNSNTLPTVTTILPDLAKQEIYQGRLPQLNTTNIFLKSGETCCFIDKAILMKQKVTKNYQRIGYSVPGLFKGTRINVGNMTPKERVHTEYFRGIIYITNKRIIFQAQQNGFDKQHRYISAVMPYSNAIELQYGNTTHQLLVPDGGVVAKAINLVQ